MALAWELVQDVQSTAGDEYTVVEQIETSPASGQIIAGMDEELMLPVEITGYEVRLSTPDDMQLPEQINIEIAGDTLTVSAEHWGGLFPFYVLTVDPKTLEETRIDNSWDLPPNEKIFFYRKDKKTPKSFPIDVTATDTVNTETQTFQLLIHADYTPNIELMNTAVQNSFDLTAD